MVFHRLIQLCDGIEEDGNWAKDLEQAFKNSAVIYPTKK